MVAFGCVVSRSVEGAALLHIFCGVLSCSVGCVGEVFVACCDCALCLVV